MSLKEKILSDTVYSAFRTVASVLRGVVAIPLITKSLGAGQYGIWTAVLTVATVSKTLCGAHLHGALIRYHDDEGTEQSYVDTLTLTLCLGVSIAVICASLVWFISVGSVVSWVADVTPLLAVVVALIVSEMVYMINVNFPRALGAVRLYELLSVSRMCMEIAGLIAVFLAGGSLFEGVLVLLATNVVINAVVSLYIFYRYTIPAPDVSRFRRYLQFGLPMVPKDLSEYILTHSDKYVLLYFLSPSAVGIYAVAHGASSVLERFGSVLNPTLYPTIADAWDAGKSDEIRAVYEDIFRYYTILAVPAVVGLSLLAEPLLELLATEQVARRGAILVPLLASGFVCRGYATVVEYVLTAAEETRKMARTTGVASGLNVALNLALVPKVGIAGAAVTTLLSQLVFTGMVYRYSRRHVSVPLPTVTLARVVVCAGLMGSVLWHFPLALPSVERLVVYPAVGVCLYLLGLVVLGEFSLADLSGTVRTITGPQDR